MFWAKDNVEERRQFCEFVVPVISHSGALTQGYWRVSAWEPSGSVWTLAFPLDSWRLAVQLRQASSRWDCSGLFGK